MTAKIKENTAEFGARVNYVNNPDPKKKAHIIASNGVLLDDNHSIIHSFEFQAEAKPSVKKPAGHLSLNFALQDKSRLTDELMAEIAEEYMRQMGIADTQFILVRHQDREHDHMHLVYNRVSYRKKTINSGNDWKKSTKICRAITEKYGLYVAAGKEQVNKDRLKGDDKLRYEMMHKVMDALKDSGNWEEFKEALHDDGIEARFRYHQKTHVANGISFTNGKYTFRGSDLDKSLSFRSLENYFDKEQANNQNLHTILAHDNANLLPPIVNNLSVPSITNQQQTPQITSQVVSSEQEQSTSSDNNRMIGNLTEAGIELLLGTQQAPISPGGGGSSDNHGWRDDDREKDKKNSYTYKRRR